MKTKLTSVAWMALTVLHLGVHVYADDGLHLKSMLKNMKVITAPKLIDHARIISDEKFKGREAGRSGSRNTSTYLVNLFREWGIKPGGSAGTYYQTFKIEPGYKISSNLQFFISGYSSGDFVRRKDYALVHLIKKQASIEADIAFAGFGISLPEIGFDEYVKLNVKGKAVIVFTGVPWTNYPRKWEILSQDNHLKYAGLEYKATNAAKSGASCLIVVDNPKDWKSKIGADRDFRIPDFNTKLKSPIPIIHVSQKALATFSGLSEEEWTELSVDISKDKHPESMLLRGRKIKLEATVAGKAWVGRNVIGVITGSDRKLRKEAVVIGAHYDHLGQEDEAIFFGANDNASGVSALLGVAEAFSKKPVPRRSIIFVAFDAEEIGKRGSKYFVKNSIVNQEKLVFMINFDMIGKNEPNHINVVASRSSGQVHEIHQQLNRHIGLTLNHPRSYRLGRSDHSPFYRAEIPVMYLFGGLDADYNSPEDTWEKLIPEKLEKVARLAYVTAFSVASLDQRIEFNGYNDSVD